MEKREVKIGHVTYDVRRVYSGKRALAELLTERISQKFPVRGPVDEPARDSL